MRTITADLAIIGSGSGNSLITPFWDDKRVVIAEEGVFGGTCLNVGCIPTKMFVRPAALARGPEEAARLGVTQHTTAVDWPAIRDRVFSRIDPISEGGKRYRDEELENVELVSQRMKLVDRGSLVTADGTRIDAANIVIAAGSRAVLPDVPGVDLPGVHTSDTVMRLPELPQKILVIGGGFIACEFAGVFSGLGSYVVQAVRSERLLRGSDDEIAERFTAEASRRWELQRGHRLLGIAQNDAAAGEGGLVAEFEVEVDGTVRTERIAADTILIATGRRPNSDLVGAEEAGLDLHEDGRIAVDEFQRVLAGGEPVPGMYAIGDVSSPWQLKHVANHEARIVIHNLENPDDLHSSHSDAVPSAVFSSPEIAQVGLTEADAVARIGAENLSVKVQNYGDTAYGWAMEDTTGVFKVIADRRDGMILGAHAMGYQASNLIQPAIMAMSFGIDAHTAARGQYWIHPALMEVTENAMLGIEIDS